MRQNPSSARLTESVGEAQRPEDASALARSIVLKQLTASPKSRRQLAVKLAERDIPDAVAEHVLDRFEDVQLIDDAEFARMWVRSRIASRSLARSALRRELADKGITGELAEAALSDRSDEDEAEAASDVVRRKLRQGAIPSDRTARDKVTRRLVGVLARKGYSPGVAFRVVQAVLEELETDPLEADQLEADQDENP